MDIELLLEAEKRGLLSQDKAELLAEARRRGLVGGEKEKLPPAARMAGVVTREGLPVATGATIGALAGAPIGGVGAIPGAAIGAVAVPLSQMVGDPAVEYVNKVFGTKLSTPTQAINNLLDRLGVAKPETEAEKIAAATAAGATAMLTPVGVGQAMAKSAKPVVSAIGKQLEQAPKVRELVGGGLGGAASEYVEQQGGGELAQMGAGLAAGIAPSAAKFTPKAGKQLPKETSELVGAAKAEGIDLLTSNVSPPTSFIGKQAQSLGQKTPLGTSGQWQKQQQQRIDSVSRLLDDLGVTDIKADEISADLIAKKQSDLKKYAGMKREIVDKLSGSNEPDALRPILPTKQATQTIDDITKQIRRDFGNGNKEANLVISDLRDFSKQIQAKDLQSIEAMRKQLGEKYKSPDMVSVKSLADKYTGKIYGALDEDIGNYIKERGDSRDFAKWKIANKNISESMQDAKVGAFKRYLKAAEETPEGIINVIKSSNASDLDRFNRAIPQGTRRKAASYLLNEAAEKTTKQVGDKSVISPDAFMREVGKYEMQLSKLLPKDDMARINGLKKIIDVTKDAARLAEMPATGQQAVPYIAGALLTDLLGGYGSAIASAAGAGAAARRYESGLQRSYQKNLNEKLAKLGNTKPNSFTEDNLIRQILVQSQLQGEQ
jgi:hypothetical protein